MDGSHILGLLLLCGSAFAEDNVLVTAERLGGKTLGTLVKDADLVDTLSGEGPFTVFAPVDKAFKALPQSVLDKLSGDKELLKQVLTYHVVSGNVTSGQLKNDMVVDTVEGMSKLRVNIYGSKVTVNGASVILADQFATNGVVHMINEVLYPLPTQSLLDYAAATPSFSQLVYIVSMADLIDFFKGGPFTLFAPTDAAFDKLPPGLINELLQNKTALVNVLEYHVILGTVYSAGLSNNQRVKAANEQELTVKIEGANVIINDAKVTTADVTVTNGVIHVIDTVLLPPSLSARYKR
ncbi:transforming growth factor-beta-induced protein ig-h3-like [Mizuhopecten yessoensis]|uniref:Transforming growth factor-beta-induced protein ig-h3 n=1 Tax=Mizuhopecten yessoensis TaxID=6573 RepID=A0A210PG87_MIZYE|nr:transforming growth factor-beta-induced protein ig-h3-like [Mizuhopecten yessoensis]OWF35508.1 Transforming growth factor-beta-induced protein ig-h3 [Mizuhopecten yessoensis]